MNNTIVQKDNLNSWVSKHLKQEHLLLAPLQGDASFRRYYRCSVGGQTYIAVDAPPATENNEAFLAITQLFAHHGVMVPAVHAYDLSQGFWLLSDLGNTLLLDLLSASNVDDWYRRAMLLLQGIQLCALPQNYPLPDFDNQHIRLELSLFSEWFLGKLLQLTLTEKEKTCVNKLFDSVTEQCLLQPQVVIHRDYHSRNLMVGETGDLSTIDYQDAMRGPITYDLVSLLKDCYVRWDEAKIRNWVKHYHEAITKASPDTKVSFEQFMLWFDWTGLQRHLKVLGIFSRLKLRDNKDRYLADMPRVVDYVLATCGRYSELRDFKKLFETRIQPELTLYLEKEGIHTAA